MGILILVILLFAIPAFADGRVCLEKNTGKLIAYQSGGINESIELDKIPENKHQTYIAEIKKARMDNLKEIAKQSGYKEKDIVIKEITDEEWKEIEYEQIFKAREEKANQEILLKEKRVKAVKQKLNLSDSEFKDLKEAVR